MCMPSVLHSMFSMVPIPNLHLTTKSYNPAECGQRAGMHGASVFARFLGVVRS